MDIKKLMQNLQSFDPELWDILQISLKRQINMLSLVPTTNAATPFVSYLKGSTLGNEFLDHHATEHYSRLEKLACRRMEELYGAEHAIVRTGSLAAASRVVLLGLAQTGDTILSFNLRKQEHCSGGAMQYKFVKFGVEPDTMRIDYVKVAALAQEQHPTIIICSPVNYPWEVEYAKLQQIAQENKALLWLDLGQNCGLVAAKKLPSPVPYGDVVTFATGDALHGPQNGIILCRNELADKLDQAVIDTGHVSLKKNVLAALNIALKEADCEEYNEYAAQVIENAAALEKGLLQTGCHTLCSPTQNHLVLVHLPEGQQGEDTEEHLAEAGLLVKPDILMTADDGISFPILRLSSLDATTRSLTPDDMYKVGVALGEFLQSPQDATTIAKLKKFIKKLVENLPLFSEDWLPEAEVSDLFSNEPDRNALIHWRI